MSSHCGCRLLAVMFRPVAVGCWLLAVSHPFNVNSGPVEFLVLWQKAGTGGWKGVPVVACSMWEPVVMLGWKRGFRIALFGHCISILVRVLVHILVHILVLY